MWWDRRQAGRAAVVAVLTITAILAAAANVNAKPARSSRRTETPEAGTAAARPAAIPVHEKVVKSSAGHMTIDVSYPLFDHPAPRARTALEAILDDKLGSSARATASAGEEGYVNLHCQVGAATTAVISFVCHEMSDWSKIADREQGIGGAPGEERLTSYLYLIDGDRVRPGTLSDLFAKPDRARPVLLKKLKGPLAEACDGGKLVPTAPLDTFTIDDSDVKFYFQIAAFEDPGTAACGQVLPLAWDDLRGLLKRNGLASRLCRAE